LKRPSSFNPNVNQVLDLFDRGVFSGTRPGPADLARRFKGVHEPVPAGLSEEQRFRFIDTLARSYLAANCSGCHSTRNAEMLNCPVPPKFDFHNLKPAMELAGQHILQTFSLNDTTTYDSLFEPQGRFKYLLAVAQSGLNTESGIWNLALPPGNLDSLRPVMLYPGFPSLSEILFRLWVRNSPKADSGYVFRALMRNANPVNEFPLDSADARKRLAWFYSAPWGSRAWEDSLAAHGFNHDSLLQRYTDGYQLDGNQMPPLNSFVPDTAALKILGEWVKYYRSGSILALGREHPKNLSGPWVRNQTLFVPWDWTGKASMLDIRGRVHRLASLGRGAYALPPGKLSGVYFFRIGKRHFKLSLL
jgi:hypothetical protein